MTLPVPLAVRLVTSKADRHVTADLHDLSFRSVVPGGFASLQMTLNRPLQLTPEEIAYYGQVTVYDTRNGNQVWAGRLDDPGRSAGDAGPLYELSATGGSAHAHDRTLPHIFVDTGTEDWESATDNARYIETETILSNGEPAILQRCPEGTQWTQTEFGEVWYRRLVDTGQRLARVFFDWDTGTTTPNCRLQTWMSIGATGAGTQIETQDWDDTGGTQTTIITSDWAAGTAYDVPRCHALRNGANLTIPAGTRMAQWWIPCLRTVLYNKEGSELTASADYATNTVLAEEIVEDLLGRILTEFDGANATVETSSYGIDHLAYREAVDAWKIFEDLLVIHPDNYWAAWERTSAGLYEFEWRQMPPTVRFEADVTDGFNAPGSAVELFNRVSIRWVGAQGRVRHSTRTSTVDLLDDAGLTRQGYVDLKFDAGSSANAIQAGDEFLAQHAIPLSGATLTIARPILDRDTGIMRMPHELVRHGPGSLIRVRGLVASQDALNATARDGVTVFRIVAADYSSQSGSVVLELDSEPVTTASLLARGKGPKTA